MAALAGNRARHPDAARAGKRADHTGAVGSRRPGRSREGGRGCTPLGYGARERGEGAKSPTQG